MTHPPAPRNDVGTIAIVFGLVALLFSSAAAIGIVFGALTVVLGAVGLAKAVRIDFGLARSISALLCGFVAIALGLFSAGGVPLFQVSS